MIDRLSFQNLTPDDLAKKLNELIDWVNIYEKEIAKLQKLPIIVEQNYMVLLKVEKDVERLQWEHLRNTLEGSDG